MGDESRSAFFYGTLMAPSVLHRVCHGSMSPENPVFAKHNLRTQSAILHGYRRSEVRHADYPGILPVEGYSVRGTYVTGLTDADIWRLDIFEGDQYRRDKVKARILTTVGDTDGVGNVEGDEVEAETYVWCAHPDDLDSKEWSFENFQKEKMRFWVGAEGEGEYAEVDDAVAAQQTDGTGGRGMNGHITAALKEEQKKDEALKNAV